MIRPSLNRTVLSVLALATVISVARPAAAITPIKCLDNRHGGNGGGSYFTGWSTGAFLAEITVWHGGTSFGNVINGIGPTWCFRKSADQIACEVDMIGRAVGNVSTFRIDWQAGERLMEVWGRSGKYLDALQFQTNFAKVSPWFGGQGGGPFDDLAPVGSFFNDFWGTSGDVVDSMALCLFR